MIEIRNDFYDCEMLFPFVEGWSSMLCTVFRKRVIEKKHKFERQKLHRGWELLRFYWSPCISMCVCAMVNLNERGSFIFNVINTGIGCRYILYHHFSKTVLSLKNKISKVNINPIWRKHMPSPLQSPTG
jgi:hypothetical protein